jgi:hypothetical protein
MATLDDVRAIAMAFPDVVEAEVGHGGGIGWRTRNGLFVWERGPRASDLTALAALGRQWPPGAVVGIRTDGLDAKAALLETYPEGFFTIPHFEGYPAVLCRLDVVDASLLPEVVTDAWLVRAPVRVARAWLEQHPPTS